jgi:hypothetical protein
MTFVLFQQELAWLEIQYAQPRQYYIILVDLTQKAQCTKLVFFKEHTYLHARQEDLRERQQTLIGYAVQKKTKITDNKQSTQTPQHLAQWVYFLFGLCWRWQCLISACDECVTYKTHNQQKITKHANAHIWICSWRWCNPVLPNHIIIDWQPASQTRKVKPIWLTCLTLTTKWPWMIKVNGNTQWSVVHYKTCFVHFPKYIAHMTLTRGQDHPRSHETMSTDVQNQFVST